MAKYSRRFLFISIFAGVIALIAFLQSDLDYRFEMRNIKSEKVIYIPPAKHARFLSFGYGNILSDYFYLWSVQFFSEKSELYRFKVISNVYDFITELDPKYIEAYRIGALIMVKDVYGRHHDPKGLTMAMKLLEKGIKKNPDNWILPFEAAQYAHFDIRDLALANKFYKMTLSASDLPEFYRNRIITAIGGTMEGFQKPQALQYWYNLWETAKDEIVRNIAFSHFYDLKCSMDIDFINIAMKQYKIKYKRRPEQLSDLIRGKIVPALPTDPYGMPYLYDSTSGIVKPIKGFIFKRSIS